LYAGTLAVIYVYIHILTLAYIYIIYYIHHSKYPLQKAQDAKNNNDDGGARKKARKQARRAQVAATEGLTAEQMAVNEQMRRALEEDQYSAHGSIVDTDTDQDDYHYRGQSVRLDRAALLQVVRKQSRKGAAAAASVAACAVTQEEEEEPDGRSNIGTKTRNKKKRREKDDRASTVDDSAGADTKNANSEIMGLDGPEDDFDRDGGSIFGQTTGSSNATWVECDKCKKWRRLRGLVDEKKLPSKWYCSMNKNDAERSRCSAPEEEYETPHTPESAADARTRKHLRVWVRRLQCNEAYEARQPAMTRGKKRAAATSSKDPYEWVRCSNASCGKWRAILRIMDAKSNVIDRTTDGEWYCVMNTWDEKTASCAAPQENLPAVGCPPWVMQDDN
jgi:hypothetical protein